MEREKQIERERERCETVKTQKQYSFCNMRSAYFPINRRLHSERERERKRESKRGRERARKGERQQEREQEREREREREREM